MPRHRPFRVSICLLLGSILGIVQSAAAVGPTLELRPGDHVSYIGNTLADRMQHDGWLETLIQDRFPKRQLVFRNLSFPGDEINKRPRSENFGSPDEWLTSVKTDVIFAFFGYNESLAGEAGLASFRKELARLHRSHRSAEIQRPERPATGPVFADRARESAQSALARRQRQQRAAGALHQGDGRCGRGEGGRVCRPVCSHARVVRQIDLRR